MSKNLKIIATNWIESTVFDPQNPQNLCDLRSTSSTEHTNFFLFLIFFSPSFLSFRDSISELALLINRRLCLGLLCRICSQLRMQVHRVIVGSLHLHRIIRSECDVLV